MTIDDFIFEEAEFVASETPIPEGDLRAYVYGHDVNYGDQQVVILARSLISANALYARHMENEHYDSTIYSAYNLREITEKPLKGGVLCDFHSSE